MSGGSVSNVLESYKNTVNNISPFYANAIIDQLKPKTFVVGISNGNGVSEPSPKNYTHGFLVTDLEEMQNNIGNSGYYPENQLISIPDLVYQYDSSRKEINQTVLIPVIVKSIQNIKQRLITLAEDTIVALIGNNETKQFILIKTYDQILNYLTDIITQVSEDVYKVDNSNSIYLLASKFFIANNDDSNIYQQLINETNNPNNTTQQVRISNDRKNVIIKSLLLAIVDSNRNINNTFNIDNTVKIMIDLALLPVGPTTTVITRENPEGTTSPTLVRLISSYSSVSELSIINKNEYTITETDNRCIIGMDIGDYIQIKFQYIDPTLTSPVVKNLLYIKKIDNYSYEIKELDSNFILRDKEEIVTNEVKLSYLDNSREFTFYYVLGSLAGNGVLEINNIS
jgi:hypothetical protein